MHTHGCSTRLCMQMCDSPSIGIHFPVHPIPLRVLIANPGIAHSTLYIGSLCSLISVVENGLIVTALMRDRKPQTSYFLYLIVLALCDMTLSALYIPVIVVDQVRIYLNYRIHFYYVKLVIAGQRSTPFGRFGRIVE